LGESSERRGGCIRVRLDHGPIGCGVARARPMSDAASFPHPSLTGDEAPFWLAALEGQLDIQACADCRTLRHPPRPVCAHCGATEHEWRTVSGRGEVWSYTT